MVQEEIMSSYTWLKLTDVKLYQHDSLIQLFYHNYFDLNWGSFTIRFQTREQSRNLFIYSEKFFAAFPSVGKLSKFMV